MFLGDKNKKRLKYYKLYNDRFVVRFFLVLTFLLGFILKINPFVSKAIMNPMDVSGDPSGCTFSSSVTSEHSAVIGMGENVADFGSTKMTTLCENSIDHTVYAIGYSNNANGNTNLINSSNNLTIPTGIATGDVSNWSMKIAKDTTSYQPANLTIENSFDSNHVVPNETTMVSSYEGGTDSSIGSSILTTYSARASTTQPGGTYSGKVKYTLTATEIYSRYTITYNANAGGDTVTSMPSPNPEQGIAITSTIYLSEATPLRTNYEFLGWSTSSSATTPDYVESDAYTVASGTDTITLYAVWKYALFDIIYDANSGSGEMIDPTTDETYKYTGKKEGDSFYLAYASNYHKSGYGFAGFSFDSGAGAKLVDNDNSNDPIVFGPNEYITVPEGTLNLEDNGTVKLYAVWVPSQGNLQGWAGCTTMNNGQITALTDVRDGNVYTVAKIQNSSTNYGKCWLMENLRLDLSDANITLGNVNTNHPTAAFIQAASNHPESTDSNFSTEYVNQITFNTDAINSDNAASYNEEGAYAWYSYGAYYNAYTATGGNMTTNITTSGTSTEGDICPAGWKLPTGYNASGDYGQLDTALGGNAAFQQTEQAARRWLAYPVNIVLSGLWYGSSPLQRGEYGGYVTTTNYTSAIIYDFGIQNTYVYPGMDMDNKYGGFTMRCLAKEPASYSLSYNANGGSFTNGTPASQTSVGDANGIYTFHLSSLNPTRSGYTFIGWTDVDGVYASSGSNYTATRQDTVLYARWKFNQCNPSGTTIGTGNSTDIKCLQDMTGSIKSSMTARTAYTLYDGRDGQEYRITVLEDGELWMTQNLNFAEDHDVVLTASDTNLISGSTFTAPASSTSFLTTSNVTSYTTPKIMRDDTYGAFYSYAAAIADTTSHTSSEVINTSICPFGWSLPVSTNFNNLSIGGQYTSSPYYFVYAGYRNGSSTTSQGSMLRIWTANNYSSPYATAWYVSTSGNSTTSSTTSSGNYKRYGESVRCIFTRNLASIYYYGNGTNESPATGHTNSQINVEIKNSSIAANGFTREGYKFTGWNTAADGTGTAIAAKTPLSSLNLNDGDSLTLYAQWGLTNTVSYNINTNDVNAEGSMQYVTHINVAEGDTFDLFASNYSRPGYGFAGWSINPNAVVNSTDTIYGPNETITATSSFIASANSNHEITLYAVWVPVAKDSNNHDLTFQTNDLLVTELSDGTTLASKPQNYVTALKDERDNEVYAVAKLADGNLWIIENFRLDADATQQVNSASLSEGWGTGFVGLADPEPENFREITVTNTYNGNDLYTLSDVLAVNAETTYASNRFPRYDNDNTTNRNPEPRVTHNVKAPNSHTDLATSIYSYGNTYNWAAANADLGYYTSWTKVQTSICPKGWTLPDGATYGTAGTFALLDVRNGGSGGEVQSTTASQRWRKYPNNFIYSGTNRVNLPDYPSFKGFRGAVGLYWSHYTDQAAAYLLTFDPGMSDPRETQANFEGLSVRCMNNDKTLTINYGTGISSISIDGNVVADGATVLLDGISTHQIEATTAPGYLFYMWTAQYGFVTTRTGYSTTYKFSALNSTLTAEAFFSGDPIQNLDPADCTFEPSAATDVRDGKEYIIKRLYDGHCWMINNLDLGRTDLSVDLTSANTNLSTTVTAATFNSWKKSSGSGTYDAGEFIPLDGTDSTTGTDYGTSYNYYAASAGTISGDVNSSNAQYDICPAGWRLPTGGSSGEYANLYSKYGSAYNMHSSMLDNGAAFAYAGGFYDSTPLQQGTNGSYWASTYNTDTDMHRLYLESSFISADLSVARNNSSSIRCILKEDIVFNDLHNMQDFYNLTNTQKRSVVASMRPNREYYFKDTRDNQTYTIAKLSDGEIWMIDNLDLGWISLSTDLTSSNTNLTNTIAAATFNGWKKTSGTATNSDGEFIYLGNTAALNNIYNYYAASAGTISGNTNDSNAYSDICPAGWRLPTGGSSGDFAALTNAYPSYSSLTTQVWDGGADYWLSGTFSNGAPTGLQSEGYYWSSTIDNGSDMQILSFANSSYTYPDALARTDGAAIRCIVKNENRSITFSYGANVTGIKVDGSVVADGSSVTLEEDIPHKIEVETATGYSINAWSATSGTIASANSASTLYTPGQSNATVSVSTVFTGPNLQDVNFEDCTSTPTLAKDNRDDKIYTIKLLDDGNCWIMENLDLGRTTLTTDLTSTNTNLINTITAATFNSWKKTSGSATRDNGEFISVDGTDSLSGTAYGTLYNYYAASAGTISGTSNYNDATSDLCPAGWRLPAGGPFGEFQVLYSNPSYNTPAKMHGTIASGGAAFTRSGDFISSTPIGVGTTGYHWSSTHDDDRSVYLMYNNSSTIDAGDSNSRTLGAAIRCVYNKPLVTISNVTYLQDLNNLQARDVTSLLNSMSYNTVYELEDNRDGRTYRVAKLKDGNIWMVDNLDLGKTALTTDLTSANTNLSTTITASTFNGWKTTTATGTNTAGEFISVDGQDATSGTNYGTLYNYYVASAGTRIGATVTQNADYDICPAGWRLPTGGPYGELNKLYSISDYNTPATFRAPITSGGAAFSLPGVAWGSTPEYTSYFASYWTSTRASDTLMYRLSMNQSSVGAESSDNRTNNFSVRCIAKLNPAQISDYTYMQDLVTLNAESKDTVLRSMKTLTTYSLTDARDSKSYTIGKFNDGNVWMAENLDLGRTNLSVNLNSMNTNMDNPSVSYSTFNGWKKTTGTNTYTAGEFMTVSGSDPTTNSPYGTLYNYYAASAGTITGSSNSNNAQYDICPAGWRLPTGGAGEELETLYDNYPSFDLLRYPVAYGGFGLSLSGYFYSTPASPGLPGPSGYSRVSYWSSTNYNSTNMRVLTLSVDSGTGDVTPLDINTRGGGNPIRCILK